MEARFHRLTMNLVSSFLPGVLSHGIIEGFVAAALKSVGHPQSGSAPCWLRLAAHAVGALGWVNAFLSLTVGGKR